MPSKGTTMGVTDTTSHSTTIGQGRTAKVYWKCLMMYLLVRWFLVSLMAAKVFEFCLIDVVMYWYYLLHLVLTSTSFLMHYKMLIHGVTDTTSHSTTIGQGRTAKVGRQPQKMTLEEKQKRNGITSLVICVGVVLSFYVFVLVLFFLSRYLCWCCFLTTPAQIPR
jgi:hypothetical protein